MFKCLGMQASFNRSICANGDADFSWSLSLASYARMFQKHFDCCSYHYFEVLVMLYLTASHDDDHSVGLVTKEPTLECLRASVVFPEDLHLKHFSLISGDLPSKRTPISPRSHTRTVFCYHINRICHQHKTCWDKNNWKSIKWPATTTSY